MKTKLLFIVTIYLAASLFISLIQSCKTCYGTIDRIELISLNNPGNGNGQPDTLVGDIGVIINAYADKMWCTSLPISGFISSSYAFKHCVTLQNEIVDSSFEMHFDRPVIIYGDTILPNIDLFQNANFVDGIERTNDAFSCNSIEYKLKFSSGLLGNTIFEKGLYGVTFTCSTTDNKTLTTSKQVLFRI